MSLSFTKRLREPIMRGEITCSVRIWHSPRVKAGGRYPLGDGNVEVTSIKQITQKQITPALAKRGGFASVADLMAIAKHGSGENIFLVEFEYVPNLDFLPLVQSGLKRTAKAPPRKPVTTKRTKKS
jgi:hypothetical protein